MPSDAVDNFFVELINAIAEVAYTLAVGEKPNILFIGSEEITGSDVGEIMQSDFIFKGKLEGVFDGRFMINIPEALAKAFSETLTGSGEPASIESAEKSAIFELMNNISARCAALWTQSLNRDITVKDTDLLDPGAEPPPAEENWIELSAGVAIGIKEATMKILFPSGMIDILEQKIGDTSSSFDQTESEQTTQEEAPAEPIETEEEEEEEEEESVDDHNIRQAQFQQIQAEPSQTESDRQIDLILDVPLVISVELGRKDLTIREILELSPGSLIELNQLAGEPVDLLINGKLFARGEVVVIDENFGIRVTHIISPQERVEKLR